jgi:hypothetical protein
VNFAYWEASAGSADDSTLSAAAGACNAELRQGGDADRLRFLIASAYRRIRKRGPVPCPACRILEADSTGEAAQSIQDAGASEKLISVNIEFTSDESRNPRWRGPARATDVASAPSA